MNFGIPKWFSGLGAAADLEEERKKVPPAPGLEGVVAHKVDDDGDDVPPPPPSSDPKSEKSPPRLLRGSKSSASTDDLLAEIAEVGLSTNNSDAGQSFWKDDKDEDSGIVGGDDGPELATASGEELTRTPTTTRSDTDSPARRALLERLASLQGTLDEEKAKLATTLAARDAKKAEMVALLEGDKPAEEPETAAQDDSEHVREQLIQELREATGDKMKLQAAVQKAQEHGLKDEARIGQKLLDKLS